MIPDIRQPATNHRIPAAESSPARGRRPGRRLVWQLVLSVTIFIFAMELVVLGFSHVSKRHELLELRNALEQDVLHDTGRGFNELHPGILDERDIDRRVAAFTINYALATIVISILVSLGTLAVFHWLAGRHLLRLIDLNRRYDNRRIDYGSLYPEDRLPRNELGELITSRNRMIESIMRYETSMEEELEKAQQQIVHTARLSLVGELTSTMVHDIKNPLAVILGRIELMKKKHADATLLEGLSGIESSARKILELAERMGRFSRLDTHRKEWIPLSRVIHSSFEMAQSKLSGRHVDVRLDIPLDLRLEADHIALEQVFANLFSNAADAMTERTRRVLEVSGKELDDHLVVTVSDTGSGIPEEQIESIFAPFYTTKEIGKGTGLGLSSCRRIIDRHGGTISVHSRVGSGTCFTLTLPRTSDPFGQTTSAA